MAAKDVIMGADKKRASEKLMSALSTKDRVKYRPEYDAYAADETTQGREPKSPDEWMLQRKDEDESKSKAN